MIRLAVLALVFCAASLLAEDKQPPKKPGTGGRLTLATGLVEKGDKESLRIKTRGLDGKLAEKAMTLKLKPAARITIAPDPTRGFPPTSAKAEDLAPGQEIEVIYVEGKDGLVLLTAIAYPKPEPDKK